MTQSLIIIQHKSITGSRAISGRFSAAMLRFVLAFAVRGRGRSPAAAGWLLTNETGRIRTRVPSCLRHMRYACVHPRSN